MFFTNHLHLSVLEPAAIYKRRWQIELFFKWIKQNLKIKALPDTSKNAVLIQIWTALMAYLRLILMKLGSTAGWRLLELTCLVQTMLLKRSSLWEVLCSRETAPPPQRFLFNVGGGI